MVIITVQEKNGIKTHYLFCYYRSMLLSTHFNNFYITPLVILLSKFKFDILTSEIPLLHNSRTKFSRFVTHFIWVCKGLHSSNFTRKCYISLRLIFRACHLSLRCHHPLSRGSCPPYWVVQNGAHNSKAGVTPLWFLWIWFPFTFRRLWKSGGRPNPRTGDAMVAGDSFIRGNSTWSQNVKENFLTTNSVMKWPRKNE